MNKHPCRAAAIPEIQRVFRKMKGSYFYSQVLEAL